MSKKLIDSLTPEQEAQFPVYLERFKAIGLSTEKTNKAKAEAAIQASYAYIHALDGSVVEKPEIIWADSPMKGAILAAQCAKGDVSVTVKEVQEQASFASYGSFEAYWVSSYAFISEQLPVEKDNLTDIVIDIVKECGVYWTFTDLVILTPKPSVISMKNDVLHSTTGKALAYENGDGFYSVNGVIKKSLMEVAIADRVAEEAKKANS